MDTYQNLPLVDIEKRYPDQWVLIEETSWDANGNPLTGIVKATSVCRSDLREPLHTNHQRPDVKTFIFYTGDKIPADVTVVL